MIRFQDLSEHERQAFTDFIYKEKRRHLGDIKQIEHDLEQIKTLYGIEPREIYCEWVQI